jgi:hypothetical protein
MGAAVDRRHWQPVVLILLSSAAACGGVATPTPAPPLKPVGPITAVAAVSVATTPSTPVAAPAAPAAPTAAAIGVPAAPVHTAGPPTRAPPAVVPLATSPPTPAPVADANRGIRFGRLANLSDASRSAHGVLVTNTSDLVKSFLVEASYRSTGAPVATASGAVNDLLPGQARAVILTSTQALPTGAQTVSVAVDLMVQEAPTTERAETARRIAFGPAVVVPDPVVPRINVDARNDGGAPCSFLVQAALVRGADDLVGVATGAVHDLEPGQTRTAVLSVTGAIDRHERVLVGIELIVQ